MTTIIIVIIAAILLFFIFKRLRKSKQRVETVPPIPVYIVGDKSKGKRGCSTPLLLFIILILGGVIIWLLMK